MSGLKTLAPGLFALFLSTLPARAFTDLPPVFADCAGQFSATMEHAWLMQDPRADEFATHREIFLSLLEAVSAEGDGAMLNRRIAAKAAQASLLQQAAFGTDSDAAHWASERAETQLATCRLLLLGG